MKDLQEDNLFGSVRQRLARYEETPSEELWAKIAVSQKRRRSSVWIYSGVGVIALTLGLLFLIDDENVVIEKESVVEKPVTVVKPGKEIREIKGIKEFIETPGSKFPVVRPLIARTVRPVDVNPIVASEKDEVASESPIANRESEITRDSVLVTSPVISKKDSASKGAEVIPPYKKANSRFQLYLSVTPSLSFQKIIPGSNDDIIIQGLANRSPFSVKRFGFAIDAGLQYDLNKIFGFYGGLSFYHQQQQLTYNYYDKSAQVTRVGDGWTFDIDRPQHSKTFDYTMTNLGAQGGVMVTLKGEKLKHKFGAGLNYTHSLNSPASYLAYQLFYRNEIKVNEKLSWFVEPMFTYSFIANEKLNEPFRLKPYRAGITGGVVYRFR